MTGLEIAGAIVGIIGTVVGIVGAMTCFHDPTKREFSYLCCFTSNIDSLKDEDTKLINKIKYLEDHIQTDRNNGRGEVHGGVKAWLTDSRTITHKKDIIVARATEVESSSCCNFVGRYSVSKDAVKTSEDMKKMIEWCTFDSVTRPLPIAATSPIPFGEDIHDINSRQVIEDGLMQTVKREDVDKIGVWGAGGVGKTTMAQRILNRGLTEGFDEIVMVTVGPLVEGMLLQKEIAEMLGLELRDETPIPRAHALRGRLSQESKTLILLDDVCQELNLEQLGIPCHPKWCTVIITSRDRDVLTRMVSVENVIELGVLDDDDDEAWDFFRKMIGTGAYGGPTAYEVMKECKGLLVALETVGQAHKDETRQNVWQHSLEQLRTSNPVDIPNLLEKVYNPLKLSYERLENENAKSTFLLCCLFAEDADIPLEQLTYFAMGLGTFEDIGELQQVRGRIRRMTDMLRNRRMLLDGSSEDHVRMHDVVRDVSIYIARERGLVKCNDCAWISSFVQQGVIPVPRLKLLFLNGKVEREMEINNDLIGGSTELINVLRIEHGSLTTLPLPLPLGNSLRTLVLRDCASLESIAVVGQLVNLEILVCRSCRSMNMLPEQVTGLKRLKLLEISECRNLIRVAAGVISSLVALEELKIVGSFGNWQGSAGGNNATASYARLREIESLRELRCLHIQVNDIELAAQPLRLPSELVQFKVHFGRGKWPASSKRSSHFGSGVYPLSREESYQREMLLLDDGDRSRVTNYGDASSVANTFLTSIEWVSAAGANRQAAFTLNLATARNIRGLSLYLFGNKNNIASSAAVTIPLLEFLSLEDLGMLEEIWSDASIPSNSFNKLKCLKLSNLPELKQMGKSSAISATDVFFEQLEIMLIEGCRKMGHLLYLEPNGDNITLVFPRLKRLSLLYLPELKSICSSRRIDSIQFPLLEEMKITSCENLKWLNDDGHCQDEDSSHLFCHPQVTFGNLKTLALGHTKRKNAWCPNVPDGFFGGLVQLQLLEN